MPCCKKEVERQSNWILTAKAHENDPEDIFERIKGHWELIASISALISGFTYIVASNSKPDWDFPDILVGGISRDALYGVISFVTFMIATASLLLAAILIGFLKVVGKEHAVKFVTEFAQDRTLYYPEKLMILSVLLMFLSALISLGGYYDWPTFVVAIIITVIIVTFLGRRMNKIQAFTNKIMKEPLQQNHINEDIPTALSTATQ
eukprot:651_1